MIKTLEQAIAEVERLPAEDQEQIGRTLLSHIEKLRALRAEIDKGIRSLDAGQGRVQYRRFHPAKEPVDGRRQARGRNAPCPRNCAFCRGSRFWP
jgi:hypothetical protein